MGQFLISGVRVKTPKACLAGQHTIHSKSSGRNADGLMMLDILAVKTKLDLTWGHMSAAESSQIHALIASATFTVTYPDPATGMMETKVFYAGDRANPNYSWNPSFSHIALEGLRVSFIEQ